MPSPPVADSPRPRQASAARRFQQMLKRRLVAGLLILAPLALTVYLLAAVFRFMDGIFSPLVDRWLEVRLPGLGVVMTLLAILLLGWLSSNVIGRTLVHWIERLLDRIPVAKSIYSATKGILTAITEEQAEAFKKVVLIEYPKKDAFALAFVTGGVRWGALDPRTADLLMVFVPTTPNPTSGFLLLVPRHQCIDLPMSVEDGVRMVISGGMVRPELPGPHAGREDMAPMDPGADVGALSGRGGSRPPSVGIGDGNDV